MKGNEDGVAGIDLLLAEAITGARATLEGSDMEGRDRVTTLVMDWDGSPGGFDLPARLTLRVGPCGDYDAQLEGASKPFASGLAQETLMTPATVRLGALIRVTDEGLFLSEMEVFGDRGLRASDLDQGMLRLPLEAGAAGIDQIRVSDLMVQRDEVYFEVSAEVSDMGRLIRAAREVYNEAWWDNTWLPSSPREALFELALGSNANPSPSEMGFEFVEFPGTRREAAMLAAADREVALSPGRAMLEFG